MNRGCTTLEIDGTTLEIDGTTLEIDGMKRRCGTQESDLVTWSDRRQETHVKTP